MKNMRLPLIIALGVAIIGIVLGSFLDFSISSAIASPDNTFGLLISAIGPTIGFAGVSVIGGGFVAFALKGKYPIWLKVIFYVLAAACLGVSIHYPAGEYFGVNGFANSGVPVWVGYIIAVFPAIGGVIGGYFLFKDCQNKNMWIVFLVIVVLLLIALLAVIPLLKGIMHRPRFRIVSTTEVRYHPWREPCSDYKDLMTTYGITDSDHFKSYPSGHTAEASILFVTITFLPLANKKFEKIQLPLFIGASVVVLFVAFARILAAAHYLSDVSTGATIILVLLIIANEIVMRIKPLQLESQPEVEEEQQA